MSSSIRICIYFLVVFFFFNTLVLFLSSMSNTIDTKQIMNRQSCDTSDVGHFINNLYKVRSASKKKVFIFGASNARDGFRPSLAKDTLTEFEVYNVGFSSGNVSEAILALDLIKGSLPPKAYQGAYAILGVTFGVVVDSSIRWNDSVSPLELEMSHYDLYERQGLSIAKKYSDKITLLFLKGTLPFRCGKSILSRIVMNIGDIIRGKKNNNLIDWDKKRALEQFAKWENAYKPEPQAFTYEIKNISRFIARVKEMNMTPIVIDLPLDTLVYKYSKHDIIYRILMKKYLSVHTLDYVDMRHLGSQSKFKDLLHPTKKTGIIWTDFLVKMILKRENNSSDKI